MGNYFPATHWATDDQQDICYFAAVEQGGVV